MTVNMEVMIMGCANVEFCPCTWDCPRHAKCCECVAHHREHESVPACFFSEEGEKTYNRSIRYLAVDHGLIKE